MQSQSGERRATFTHMKDGTAEDWKIISGSIGEFARTLPDRVLAHLKLSAGDYGGFAVDRMTHGLQTATLAHRDGQDEEYVVCALLHDMGDTLGTFNHADVAAEILQPFVSAENYWMVKHHAISRATTSSISSASTATFARSTTTIRTIGARWNSAPSMTRPRSIRRRKRCRCRSSNRWYGG